MATLLWVVTGNRHNDIHTLIHYTTIAKHQNDLASVKSWVSELECLEYNSITIFKAQGTVAPDSVDNIATTDFILG